MYSIDKIKGLFILIVEDEKIAQKTIATILTRMGCKLEFAETGKEALEKFKPNQYDLILMDMGLPDMRGTEITTLIRKQEKNNKTPIVALTAYYIPSLQTECNKAGIDAVYSKPLIGDELEKVLIKHARPPI